MFHVEFQTRHTDTFGATPFVHTGVLLALTEMAYAQVEDYLGISKPLHVVAVQRKSEADYRQPLHWRDGASVVVSALDVSARGFSQEFVVRSGSSDAHVATFIHHWVWLDTDAGRRVDLPSDIQERLRKL
jgi:acyl-CoA thioesterase FadM